MLQVRIWRFVALKQGCSVSLLYFLHGYQTVMQQQYSHTAGNSFDHFENKEKTDVYVCVRVYLCRLSIRIQAYAVCGFEYQKVFAYGPKSILKPPTHQTNIIQLVAMRADRCVGSFPEKKLHSNTPRRPQVTVDQRVCSAPATETQIMLKLYFLTALLLIRPLIIKNTSHKRLQTARVERQR